MRHDRVGFRRAWALPIALVCAAAVIAPGSPAQAATRTAAASAGVTAPAAGTYEPVGPIRLLDTGAGTGAPKAAVASHQTLSVHVAGVGDVPLSGVSAVVLNVTVAAPTGSGYVTAYPYGGARPTTSSVNFTAGRTVPNLVVVRLGTGGKVSLYNGSTGSVRLVADVSGYYTAGAPTQAGTFASLAPTRLLDTGSGNGAPKKSVAAHATLTFQVGGRGGVPSSGVASVVLNVTAAGPSGSGYVTAYPDGVPRPIASTLNFSAGRTTANAVVVRLGTGGKVSLYNGSTGSVRLIADVSGYFSSGTAAVPGAFVALTPTRVLDTGAGTGWPKQPVLADHGVSLHIAGAGGVPASGVSAVILNVTVASETASGYITVFPLGNMPKTSNLNFQAGHDVANLVLARVRPDGLVELVNRSAGTVRLVADVAGYVLARPSALSWGAAMPAPPSDNSDAGPISCASATFCAAVVDLGKVTTYDGSTWSAPTTVDAGVQLTGLSCATATFCVVAGVHDAMVYNGTTWSAPVAFDPQGEVTSLSCPSAGWCMAVDANFATTQATGHAFVYSSGSWVGSAVSSLSFGPVSCASSSFCGAVNIEGDFFAWHGASWASAGPGALVDGDPNEISCTTSSFCAAVNGFDRTVQTFDGTSWDSPVSISSTSELQGLSCVSSTFCIVTSDDISASIYNGATWSAPAPVIATGTSSYVQVSCSGSSFCALLSSDGYGSTYNGASWSAAVPVDPATGVVAAFACATTTSCIAVTDHGYDETFDGSTWSAPAPLLPRQPISHITCPTATWCMAVSDGGQSLTIDHGVVSAPTADGLGAPGNEQLLSCSGPTFCVVGGGGSTATYNGISWSAPSPVVNSFDLSALSCTDPGYCLAVSANLAERSDGSSWAQSTIDTADTYGPLTCGSATFCVAIGEPILNGLGGAPGGEDAAVYDGSAWSPLSSVDSGGTVLSLSCPTASFCAGSEALGTVVTWDGTSWSDPVAVASVDSEITQISCPVPGSCVGIGPAGTYVGHS